jgi:hypothetical protein
MRKEEEWNVRKANPDDVSWLETAVCRSIIKMLDWNRSTTTLRCKEGLKVYYFMLLSFFVSSLPPPTFRCLHHTLTLLCIYHTTTKIPSLSSTSPPSRGRPSSSRLGSHLVLNCVFHYFSHQPFLSIHSKKSYAIPNNLSFLYCR